MRTSDGKFANDNTGAEFSQDGVVFEWGVEEFYIKVTDYPHQILSKPSKTINADDDPGSVRTLRMLSDYQNVRCVDVQFSAQEIH